MRYGPASSWAHAAASFLTVSLVQQEDGARGGVGGVGAAGTAEVTVGWWAGTAAEG